ncbi:MAG: phosphate signaling complex protein PhoU [Paludibacter sp.]|nr:phosphate signaling complex protein PhoU [Paludibacter sp.]
MKHTETELLQIKNSISEMWILVLSQLRNATTALLNSDRDLARVVLNLEKRVNAFELKIDRDCENYIALFTPVAIDLRLVLSILKINKTLERIGDYAEGIARFVLLTEDMGKHGELLETVKIREMAKCVETMLEKSLDAFNEENSAQAGMVFTMDNQVDNIYFTSFELLSKYVAEHPADALYVLHLGTVLRKIERSGDHCNNIMEEIVFYLDARVLKHQKKDK